MKKITALFCAVCMALLLSVPAFADGRGPAFTEYEVVCTKDTTYYEENWDADTMEKAGTFPAGTTLTVTYEYEQKDTLYGNVVIHSGEETEWVYIRLSDVQIKNKTYLPKKSEKLPHAYSVQVIGKGGIPMYAGPNQKYDVVKTIPHGAKLTYEYGNDTDEYFCTWVYVTHMGKSGWIYVYPSDTKNGVAQLPADGEKAEVWALKDGVSVYSGISYGNIDEALLVDFDPDYVEGLQEEPDRVIGTLKSGQKYTYRYKHESEFGVCWYYVTVGLRSGWVYGSNDTSALATSVSGDAEDKYLLYKPAKVQLYTSVNSTADPVTVSIARNTPMNPEYMVYADGHYYYETIQGKTGWYNYSDISECCVHKVDAEEVSEYYSEKNENTKPAPIYDDILSKDKTIGSIPVGGSFKLLYVGGYETGNEDEDNWEWNDIYYVRCGSVTGWVETADVEDPDVDASYDEEEALTENVSQPQDEEVWEDDEALAEEEMDEAEDKEDAFVEDTNDAAPARSGMSAWQIVLVCVCGGAVLALTAAVTLLLIRRKRKNG